MTDRDKDQITLGQLDPTVRDLALRAQQCLCELREGVSTARSFHLDATIDRNGIKGATVVAYEEFESYRRKVGRG